MPPKVKKTSSVAKQSKYSDPTKIRRMHKDSFGSSSQGGQQEDFPETTHRGGIHPNVLQQHCQGPLQGSLHLQ